MSHRLDRVSKPTTNGTGAEAGAVGAVPSARMGQNTAPAGPNALRRRSPSSLSEPDAPSSGESGAPAPRRSYTRTPSPGKTRIAWTPDLLWAALCSEDRRQFAAAVGCGLSNVHGRIHEFQVTSPGGSGFRHAVDRDIHHLMARMLNSARHEVLAAVAFVSPMPPPVFDRLLVAAERGVEVRLIFRSDNLTGGLVQRLQRAGVEFRILADLHAKFLITDTTAMNGSANFTQASADRASEVATFFSDLALVHDLRTVFYDYWQRARPY